MKLRASLAMGVLLVARSAAAQSTSDEVAGRALFEEGRRLMQQGDYKAACPKLEEGERVSPGVGMAFNLGECFEKVGKLASAWAAFSDAAGMARAQGQTDREKVARDRAAALAPRLPHLKLALAPGADVEGLLIKRDGVVVGRAQWTTSIPVDPGPHTLLVSAPKRVDATVQVDTPEASERIAQIPVLALVPVVEKPVEKPAPVTPPPPSEDPDKGNTQRVVGLVTGGVGIVGLGVGAVYGLMAKSKKSDSDSHCFAGDVCDADGLVLRHQASGRADVATVGFIAGGVLVAAGVVIYLVAPRASARVGVRSDGVMVRF